MPSIFRSFAPSLSSSSNPSPSPVMSVSLQPVQDSSSPSTSTLSAPPTPSSLSSPSPSGRPSIRTFEPSNSYDVTSAINVNAKKKNSLSPFDSEASTDYFIVGIIIGTAGAVGAVYMVFMKTCILKV